MHHLDHDIEGRHVLILEDIIDSGSTLKMICEMFRERKPASIRICTLLDKPTGRKVDLILSQGLTVAVDETTPQESAGQAMPLSADEGEAVNSSELFGQQMKAASALYD